MTNEIQTTQSKGHTPPGVSKGHQANIGKFEYFTIANGELYRAPLANPIMTDGYRGGARWEAPVHMAAAWMDMVKAQVS